MSKKITIRDDHSWWLVKVGEDDIDDTGYLVQAKSFSSAVSKANKKEKEFAKKEGLELVSQVVSCTPLGDVKVIE